jgi:hypothetical protein
MSGVLIIYFFQKQDVLSSGVIRGRDPIRLGSLDGTRSLQAIEPTYIQ